MNVTRNKLFHSLHFHIYCSVKIVHLTFSVRTWFWNCYNMILTFHPSKRFANVIMGQRIWSFLGVHLQHLGPVVQNIVSLTTSTGYIYTRHHYQIHWTKYC